MTYPHPMDDKTGFEPEFELGEGCQLPVTCQDQGCCLGHCKAQTSTAPETIEVNGVWYDRRDTVDALTGLLAEARKKIETYKGIIREYRLKELDKTSAAITADDRT